MCHHMSTIAACMCAYCHQAQAPTVRDMICHPFHSCVEAAVELAVLCVCVDVLGV